MNIMLDVFALAACNIASSDEKTRPYLRGVHVKRDAKGTRYTGCDGHLAIILYDENDGGDAVDVIVPKEIIGKPGKAAPRWERLAVENGSIRLGSKIADYNAEMTYPDVMRLVPALASDDRCKKQVHISPIIGTAVHKAAQILSGRKVSLPIFLPSEDDATAPAIGLFNTGEGLSGFALAMPVHGRDSRSWVRPTWAS